MKHNPHKWANVIKAWADGEQLQFRVLKIDHTWTEWWDFLKSAGPIDWDNPEFEFRIRPEGE
jgi:hypothetical protein